MSGATVETVFTFFFFKEWPHTGNTDAPCFDKMPAHSQHNE